MLHSLQGDHHSVQEVVDAAMLTVDARTSQDGGRHTLRLAGSIDLATQSRFKQCLEEAAEHTAQPDVSLDLTNIDFIGSNGISLLLKTLHRLREQHRRLTVTGCSPRVARLFSVLKVEHLLAN